MELLYTHARIRMPGTEWPSQTGSTLVFYLANCNEGGCEMNMHVVLYPLPTGGGYD